LSFATTSDGWHGLRPLLPTLAGKLRPLGNSHQCDPNIISGEHGDWSIQAATIQEDGRLAGASCRSGTSGRLDMPAAGLATASSSSAARQTGQLCSFRVEELADTSSVSSSQDEIACCGCVTALHLGVARRLSVELLVNSISAFGSLAGGPPSGSKVMPVVGHVLDCPDDGVSRVGLQQPCTSESSSTWRVEAASPPAWGELQSDVLGAILRKLSSADAVSATGVCRHWRCAAVQVGYDGELFAA
jgi:hypothetical protein